MTDSTIQLEPSNIQNLLIAIVVISAIIYGYLEFAKIKDRLSQLESHYNSITNKLDDINNIPKTNISYNQEIPSTIVKNSNNMENFNKSIMETIIDDIEKNEIPMDEVTMNEIPMSGLFISVNSKEVFQEDSTEEKIVELDNSNIKEVNEEEDVNEDVNQEVNEDVNQDVNEDVKQDVNEDVNQDVNEDVNLQTNYEEYTIRELKDKLSELGLPTSGNKSKLIQRIVSNQK